MNGVPFFIAAIRLKLFAGGAGGTSIGAAAFARTYRELAQEAGNNA